MYPDPQHGFQVKSIIREEKFLTVTRRVVPGKQEQVMISYSFWAAVTISCSMNLDRYPFADTTCRYRLASQSLGVSQLLLRLDPRFNVSSFLDRKEVLQ